MEESQAIRHPKPTDGTATAFTGSDTSVRTPTLYFPVVSPPTPSPSPRLSASSFSPLPLPFLAPTSPASLTPADLLTAFDGLSPADRHIFLSGMLPRLMPSELLFASAHIAPRLRRDFLRELPDELALHVLSFVQEHTTLTRCMRVSQAWRRLARDEEVWRSMVERFGFEDQVHLLLHRGKDEWGREFVCGANGEIPYRRLFQYCMTAHSNWTHGGRLLRSHRIPLISPEESGVVTSLAANSQWVVVGLENAKVHAFHARTGVLARTLVGHASGVWAVALVTAGGRWRGGPEANAPFPPPEGDDAAEDEQPVPAVGLHRRRHVRARRRRSEEGGPPPDWSALGELRDPETGEDKASDMAYVSEGWGQPGSLVVTAGCDKDVRVWDLTTGRCLHALSGHTSTIRCIRVLHGRPIAVTGSRDGTLRVWDVRAGRCQRHLSGHEHSVRALDIFGNKAVSGSYDRTCRLWDVDTGQCLHVFRGHYHQIYTVAFDGVRIASAGLDTTVRVWDAVTGECSALLQGHTALVCQVRIGVSSSLLITGGLDGRVITYSLDDYSVRHKIPAHDSSVTALQFDSRFLVTGGADGRVRLFNARTGDPIRELTEPSESVWKVVYNGNVMALSCKRAGKTVTEIWGFWPEDDEHGF